MQATQRTIDLITEYYAAMEAKDTERYRAYLADDMLATFANSPALVGAAAFVEAIEGMLAQAKRLHHDVVQAWEDEGGRVIFESIATWTLLDGTQISIPACSVCTMLDGKFTEQTIYVDNAPLSAALEGQQQVRA